MSIKKLFGHLKVVTIHRTKVFWYCLKAGIPINGLKHDLSKFSYTEFVRSVKYFKGTASPIFNERIDNEYYSDISVHHTNKNKHHFEFWIDIFKGDIVLKKMPLKYAIEYALDMISASSTYEGKSFKKEDVLNFFLARKDWYLMHEATKEFVIYILTEYKDNGFKNIKKRKLKKVYEEIGKKYSNTEFLPIDHSKKIPMPKFENVKF